MILIQDSIHNSVAFLKANRLIAFLFLFTAGFYIYQHSTGFSWDFAVYAMNAQYFFGGFYFEWARSPLASLVMAALDFASFLVEYLYIILVSMLHLYSSIKFADAYGIARKPFYAFSLTPFAIMSAFSVGTELFSVALLQLFLASLKGARSGILYGLASLLRYSNFIYVVLIVFQRNLRKIFLFLFLSVMVFIPWLLYNWYAKGDPLTGIADFYALNFYFRSLIRIDSFNIFDILVAWNMLLPFFVFAVVRLAAHRKKISENDFIMLAFISLTVLSYSLAIFKEPRFLYASSIPLAYFAVKSTGRHQKLFIYSFVIITLLSVLFIPSALENPTLYKHIAATSEKCAAQSNVWVPLNYYGLAAEPFPYMEDVNASIENGYRIILFKNVGDPEYVKNASFLNQFEAVENNSAYIILGDKTRCKDPAKIDKTFLERQNDFYNKHRTQLNLTSCKILFPLLCR